jgi:hypothetical protein
MVYFLTYQIEVVKEQDAGDNTDLKKGIEKFHNERDHNLQI